MYVQMDFFLFCIRKTISEENLLLLQFILRQYILKRFIEILDDVYFMILFIMFRNIRNMFMFEINYFCYP